MVVPREEDESSKGQGVREAEEEEEEGLKGDEEETEVLENSKVSIKYMSLYVWVWKKWTWLKERN